MVRVVGYLPRPPPVPAAELAQWLGLYLSLRLVLPPGPATEGNPQWTRTARAGPREPKHFLPAPRAECPECGEVPDPSLKVRFRHTFVLFLVALKEMPYWAETLAWNRTAGSWEQGSPDSTCRLRRPDLPALAPGRRPFLALRHALALGH